MPKDGGDYESKIEQTYSEFFIYKVTAIQDDDSKVVYDVTTAPFKAVVTGDWFNVKVSDDDKKKLEIYIEPNATGKERELNVELSVSITHKVNSIIKIKQNK